MDIIETASSYDNLGQCAARIGKKLTQSVSEYTYKAARRVAILVLGSTILAAGIVMVVTPGPAIVVIPIGLAILSAEFALSCTPAAARPRHFQQAISTRRAGKKERSRRNQILDNSAGRSSKERSPAP